MAILKRPYVRMILTGRKTIESRLTRTAAPPYACTAPGERLFLKASGGPFLATAVAGRVAFYEDLTPARIDQFRQRLNDRIGGEPAYWQLKRTSRFASFIELGEVEPLEVGPRFKASPYRAWFVLPDEASPLHEVTLTAGAIRNRYVSIAGRTGFFPEGPFTLELPDGRKVQTDLFRGQRLRWRGWGELFQAHELRPGDRVRFVALPGARYRVSLRRLRNRNR